MSIRPLPLALALLMGCNNIDDLKDKVSGYTNPTVVEGLVLGVAEPDFYQPTPRGLEARIGEKLAWLRSLDEAPPG